MKPTKILLPINFYTIITQIILTIVVDYTKESNIEKQLEYYKNEVDIDYTTEMNKLNRLIVASYILLSLELISMFVSWTIFINKLTVFKIILHLISDLCLCWFIWQSWISEKFWIVFTLGCICCLILEFFGLINARFLRRIDKEHKYFY